MWVCGKDRRGEPGWADKQIDTHPTHENKHMETHRHTQTSGACGSAVKMGAVSQAGRTLRHTDTQTHRHTPTTKYKSRRQTHRKAHTSGACGSVVKIGAVSQAGKESMPVLVPHMNWYANTLQNTMPV